MLVLWPCAYRQSDLFEVNVFEAGRSKAIMQQRTRTYITSTHSCSFFEIYDPLFVPATFHRSIFRVEHEVSILELSDATRVEIIVASSDKLWPICY